MKKTLLLTTCVAAISLPAFAQKVCYDVSIESGPSPTLASGLNDFKLGLTDTTGILPPITDASIQFFNNATGPVSSSWTSSPAQIDLSWDPTTGNVFELGFNGLPATQDTKRGEFELCHACYDIIIKYDGREGKELTLENADGSIREGTKDGELRFTVDALSLTSRDSFKIDGVFEVGEVFSMSIANIEVCYCPVPEPSTALLGSLALLGIIGRRRR